MNTWGLGAAPESTQRWWRAGVHGVSDEMVDEALGYAAEILRAEGLMRQRDCLLT